MKINPLTPEEKKVIEGKGTEAPFSGEYDNFFEAGVYVCRRCEAVLYRSEDKFEGHCGWPSFDAEISGAVKRTLDADGRRTEITCARCDAHLGHVFEGEKMTDRDTRHCVNSLSMKFVPKRDLRNAIEVAYFGGGCFWCMEAVFKKIRGVLSVVPGYAGGEYDSPTYQQVSAGKTGHAEVVKIEFDSTVVSFEALLEIFFATHDPTTPNRQGVDVGSQYRSIILFVSEVQKEIAEKTISQFEAEKIYDQRIITELKPLSRFFEAESYHQNYFEKNPTAAYCQAVISPKLNKLRKEFKDLLKKK